MSRPSPMTDISSCNLCGSSSAHDLYPMLGMIRCDTCGLVRTKEVPTPERLEQVYSATYFRSSDSDALGYNDYMADRGKISKTFHRRMQEIERWIGRKGKLLDVGCAMGFSLDVARERGWEIEGIEISAFARDFARRNLDINFSSPSLNEASFEPESFDVITMWDYIEHNADPVGEIARANRLLKTGGLLALTTPDIGSIPARISKSRWMGIKQEEHLYYFSPDTMRRMLRAHGFEMVRLSHVGKYIDLDFFIQRMGHYSKAVEKLFRGMARLLGIGDAVVYINPHDIMLVYGEKQG